MTAIVPALTIAVVTFLASLPWGLPADSRLALPLLPYLVIHYWTLRRGAAVPDWLVFAAGLSFDLLSDGPLGYWSLVYLLGYALTIGLLPWAEAGGALRRWLALGETIAALAPFEVALSSIYFDARADWGPPLVAALWLTALYPVVAAPLRLLAGARAADGDGPLLRGA